MSTPTASLVAEWAPHARCWLAYPADAELWGDDLAPAQAEFVAFCRTLAAYEPVTVLVPDLATADSLHKRLGEMMGERITLRVEPYGDIWLRDTGPLFLRRGAARGPAACFAFNGWGERFVYAADQGLAARIALAAGWQPQLHDFVLEGGAIEGDGAGLLMTTRQCLLRGKRNAGMTEAAATDLLRQALGVQQVIWLDQGLQHDHTDGHIDTLARFIGPGQVVCMRPRDASDPNYDALVALVRDLRAVRQPNGQPLQVTEVPSPGLVADPQGEPMPASYLNFYIGNGCVLVPTYGADAALDAQAVAAIGALFPQRQTHGLMAKAILSGGGAFHCMSQQQPALPAGPGEH